MGCADKTYTQTLIKHWHHERKLVRHQSLRHSVMGFLCDTTVPCILTRSEYPLVVRRPLGSRTASDQERLQCICSIIDLTDSAVNVFMSTPGQRGHHRWIEVDQNLPLAGRSLDRPPLYVRVASQLLLQHASNLQEHHAVPGHQSSGSRKTLRISNRCAAIASMCFPLCCLFFILTEIELRKHSLSCY